MKSKARKLHWFHIVFLVTIALYEINFWSEIIGWQRALPHVLVTALFIVTAVILFWPEPVVIKSTSLEHLRPPQRQTDDFHNLDRDAFLASLPDDPSNWPSYDEDDEDEYDWR